MTTDLEHSFRQVLKSVLIDVAKEVLLQLRGDQAKNLSTQHERNSMPRLLSPRETAKALSMSERTLYKLTKEGVA